MKAKIIYLLLTTIISIAASADTGLAQSNVNQLSKMVFTLSANELYSLKTLNFDFKGYTSHWDRYAWNWYSYFGLFLTSQTEIKSKIRKMEMDIGNRLLLDELWIQKGFVCKLSEKNPQILRSPSKEQLEIKLNRDDVLVLAVDRDPVMTDILVKLPEELQFRRNSAFYLQRGERTLFVVASHTNAF